MDDAESTVAPAAGMVPEQCSDPITFDYGLVLMAEAGQRAFGTLPRVGRGRGSDRADDEGHASPWSASDRCWIILNSPRPVVNPPSTPIAADTEADEDRGAARPVGAAWPRLVTAAADLRAHGQSRSWFPETPPDAVAYPETTDEVSRLVAICARHGCPVVAWGAGTSLEGTRWLGGASPSISPA